MGVPNDCCHSCARRPACLVAKASPAGRGICMLVAGSRECEVTQRSGWCRICRRWVKTLEMKEGRRDTQTLF
jgi:hypothetical protein